MKKSLIFVLLLVWSSVNPVFAASATRFSCAVKGLEAMKSKMASDQICQQFQTGFDRVLAKKTLKSGFSDTQLEKRWPWVRLSVRFFKPDGVAATLVHSDGRRLRSHPEILLSVSDKIVDMADVEFLVRETSKLLAKN